MKNFKKIELPSIEDKIKIILDELLLHEAAWLINQYRQNNIRLFKHTQNIKLIVADESGYPLGTKIEYMMSSRPSRLSKKFPNTLEVLNMIAIDLDSTIRQAYIGRLIPHKKVYKHIDPRDDKEFFNFCDRYHLVLQSKNGSPLYSGDESVVMQENELWWFDNNKLHWAENPSDDWRTHLIIDMKPNSGICKRDVN